MDVLAGGVEELKTREAKLAKKLAKQLAQMDGLSKRVVEIERAGVAQGDFLDVQVRSIKEEVLEFQARVQTEFDRQTALFDTKVTSLVADHGSTVSIHRKSVPRHVLDEGVPVRPSHHTHSVGIDREGGASLGQSLTRPSGRRATPK